MSGAAASPGSSDAAAMRAAAPRWGQPSPHWGAAAALAALVAVAVAAWSHVLGPSVAQAVPVAAGAALVAAGRLSRRAAAGVLVAWLPVALLLAGVPVGRLLPGAWPAAAARLEKGAEQLTAPSGAHVALGPWPLAAALVLAGTLWMAAAALAAPPSPSGRRRSASFAIAALPWIVALTRGAAHTPIWEGALVLLAGLLLWLSSRVAGAQAVALSLVVALVAAATAQAVAPRGRWFGFPSAGQESPSFSTLIIEPTFGPLPDRRRGRSMLEIRAPAPALWRMQELDIFDWFGWRIDHTAEPALPQPAAKPMWADVRVNGLQDDLAVAPGRIERLVGRRQVPVAGEAWRLTPAPRQGDRYRVRADVVRAGADQLQLAPAPTDSRLQRYTHVGWLPRSGMDVPLFGQPRDPDTTKALAATPYRPVGALASRLAAGATTEWEVVARVLHYLRDSGRFRYTTHVPAPGLLPLADFLLRDHAGYCQHFAGAAALLLRLAGVPARVVVGFATGAPKGTGRFDVRDLDAHDWIEVYFQGYGWVPFNPTPAAAPADVARALDPLAPATDDAAGGGWPGGRAVAALLAALVLLGVPAARRRRRGERAPAGELLARLARRAGASVEASSTLGELRDQLDARLGPHTSALAAAAERLRYAQPVRASVRPSRPQIVRALVSDVGFARAALLLVLPVARGPSRRRA